MEQLKVLREMAANGAACLVWMDGCWQPGVVVRENEDGTFTVQLDEHKTLLPYTYGVAPSEVSVNDKALWPEVFAMLTEDRGGMSINDFGRAMVWSGYKVTEEKNREVWLALCGDLFDIHDVDALLTEEQSYELVRSTASCAKQIGQAGAPRTKYRSAYVNEVRMGGREPKEISRAVTLQDALEALGVDGNEPDPSAVAKLDAFEVASGVRVPPVLRKLLSSTGFAKAVHDVHPNNPDVVFPTDEECDVEESPPVEGNPQVAMTILYRSHTGDAWNAVFSEGDEDAQVYYGSDPDEWVPVSPSSAHFFWDIAQTGLAWWQAPTISDRKETERTDIGLKLVRR
ncbi:hypothetical protein [Roseimicrobium sp. ORNL1]|uniref:hypothetical protein n=1 Tax=Roseimicrobium sp. ORNL1 TaxID=2711231 RepID=UPI0013E114F9|nr:hypothetical protein [Roseimicrobium sp. ORNL1]QIF03145.1 hypothetical protein G5S37_16985 [Roseimicrobium sp. ORNL1]